MASVAGISRGVAVTKVMHQWEGKTRSDYVTYTVGQLRDHVEANPPKAGQVI
jgi:hypothetical protein